MWQLLQLMSLFVLTAAIRKDYNSKSIQPYTHTNWGTWGFIDWCPEGTYAYSFALKVESARGLFRDDTGLNGVRFNCRYEFQI